MPFGGGILTNRRAAFASDGAKLVVCCGNMVRVYSAVVGEELLKLEGHTSDVTAVAAHPRHTQQVITASLDKTLRVWNVDTGELITTHHLEEAVHSMVVPFPGSTAYLSVSRKGGTSGRVLMYKLGQGKPLAHNHKTSGAVQLVESPSGAYVAYFERHTLTVLPTARTDSKPLIIHHTKAFTCAAISPQDDRLVTGDASGRLLVFYGVAAAFAAAQPGSPPQETDLRCATYHWHAHAVTCVCWSRDGSSLLSGGREAVLVLWQLEAAKRNYLPRLGGTLAQIVPSPSDAAKFALCQQDNTVRIVNTATMTVDASIHGVRLPPRSTAATAAASVSTLQPGSGHLVLNADNALLQFYDAARDRHVAKLAVAPRNAVSMSLGPGDADGHFGVCGPPSEPHVTRLAFDASGGCMATVDVRPETAPGGRPDACLRFWDRAAAGAGRSNQPYTLNTQVDAPHQLDDVGSLAHHPTAPQAATASTAGEVKLWVRQPVRGSSTATCWRCQGVLGYKGRPLSCLTYTADGALLLAAAGGCVVAWDPKENELVGTLQLPLDAQGGSIHQLIHVPDSPFLVGRSLGGTPMLVVWNLLTASIWWCHTLTVATLAADPAARRFSVALPPLPQQATAALQHGLVLTFDPADPKPLFGWLSRHRAVVALHYATPGSGLAAAAAAATPTGCSPLLVVMEDRSYATVRAPGCREGEEEDVPGVSDTAREAPVSAFEAAFGRGKAQTASTASRPEVAAGAVAMEVDRATPSWEQLFDTPSHVLAPLPQLSMAFLELMTIRPPASKDAA